ncbi:unnamed protein product [Psylliodes chrysocephalus]|uniref:endo-polygalacturonase n=1 Tax=Psylliodes chrysocephalus TaxID=3402493 RepID=A0A9P0CKV8_9CUCU|nr:unnamed protein product [Psylliodes chrysocephala]
MNSISLCSLFIIVAASTASPVFNSTLDSYSGCNINRYEDVASVTANCKNIYVGSFSVLPGKTLKLALQPGTTLTFNGNINFGYIPWDGPLMWITGNAITVQGSSTHLLDGRGEKWWDGHGDHSNKKKPQFMLIQATGGSVFKNIKVRNCPHTCIGISDSHDLTLQYWNIDSKLGDTKGGANTDGFDIAKSYRVTIRDTSVWNQDDCICVNQGQHLLFDNMQCTGGHGLSIAVGVYNTYALNTVHNVTFQNSAVKNSRLGSFAVPPGQTLKLALQSGTTLTFNGEISFGYTQWTGPLMWITGNSITVQGSSSHLLNGRGEKWWDGHGDHSQKKKPQFMLIQATGGSVFKNIKVKNCPHTCIGISDSHDLTLQNWNIDSKDGDTQGGANTDGFDVAKSYKVTIKDTSVWNQDDCICVNQGQHLLFDNMQCTGGHGLSIAVGVYNTYALNTVHNVTFQNSAVHNSRLGIAYYGINVQQDYTNDGDTHKPLGNIKIKELTMQNIYGTLSGSNSQRVYILCGAGGCNNWSWSGINLNGASKVDYCNFSPNGFNC